MARTSKPRKRRKRGKSAASNSSQSLSVLPIATLTVEEERDRLHLERRVERAFYESGLALLELRARKLYLSTHSTFEEYCQERFNFTRQAANYLIAGASVFKILTTNGCQILPTSERQVRPITSLDEPEQVESWKANMELTNHSQNFHTEIEDL